MPTLIAQKDLIETLRFGAMAPIVTTRGLPGQEMFGLHNFIEWLVAVIFWIFYIQSNHIVLPFKVRGAWLRFRESQMAVQFCLCHLPQIALLVGQSSAVAPNRKVSNKADRTSWEITIVNPSQDVVPR